ncbi:MAG: nuclear transport factor 2 family protein [SAR324 cluster bacterium]|nr:nuclear transport factor 2 family protein [SAR324 cluster bacterium]
MITIWHQMIKERNISQLNSILSEDIVLHSPIVHTPLEGRKIVSRYLTAAFHTFLNDSFHYVREVIAESTAVLEFTVELDGVFVNGVDMISWDNDGKIVDFKVMIRPLKAVNLIHQKMGAMLEKLEQNQALSFQ